MADQLAMVGHGPLTQTVRSVATVAVGMPHLWLRLPEQRLTSTGSGSQSLRDALSFGHGVLRVGRPVLSVLELPADRSQYLRGKSRQAVRTNLGHAADLGLTARPVPEQAEALRLLREVLSQGQHRGRRHPEWFMRYTQDRWYAALASDGTCLGLAAVVVADQDAYLRAMVSANERDEASQARYLLHTTVVHSLIEQGVVRLWADGPLALSSGLRYFQRLLGYQCVRPVLRSRLGGRKRPAAAQ